MGNHCVGIRWARHHAIGVEVRLWHVALDDLDNAAPTSQWRDAEDQRALPLQRVRGGIARGDGPG